MNISSSLKLLSMFLIGAGSAAALMLSGALTPRPSDKLSSQTSSIPHGDISKSSGALPSSRSNPDRPGQESPLALKGNTETAPAANFITSPNIAATSFTASPGTSRSAFATSAAAVDAPAAPSRSIASSSSSNNQASPSFASGASSPASGAGSGGAAAAAPFYGANGASQPYSGGYGYTAPIQGGSSSAAPAGSTIEVGPAVNIPASLAQPTPAAKLTPEEQSLAQDLGKQFLDEVGGTAPTDPAGENAWNKAQQKNDDLYKLYFGYQAYNAQSGSAYRDSIPPAQGK